MANQRSYVFRPEKKQETRIHYTFLIMTLSRMHVRGEREKWVTRVWRWRRDEGRRV